MLLTYRKHWCSKNFDFPGLNNAPPGQFLAILNSSRLLLNFKICCNLKILGLGKKCLNFERDFESKSPCFLLNQSVNFEWNRKWKIPKKPLKIPILCFSSYENRELNIKLWCVRACKKLKCDYFAVCFLSLEHCWADMFYVFQLTITGLSNNIDFYISKNFTFWVLS